MLRLNLDKIKNLIKLKINIIITVRTRGVAKEVHWRMRAI